MSQSHAAFSASGDHVRIVRISDRQTELDKLPPPDTKRWVTRRKAQVLDAVKKGVLTMEEACARYRLSEEEYKSWERLAGHHGLEGLRVTRLKDYRGQVGMAPTAE